jgi:RNA polymerase sigma factor (sigma-70 family)
VALDAVALAVPTPTEDLLALDEALARLGSLDERMARLVEMRFFGGMTEAEAADVLGVSERTVKRDWRKAKALLYRLLCEDPVR